MDPKELRELIELISRSNFATFELEREGFKLKLVKGNAAPGPVATVTSLASPVPVEPAGSLLPPAEPPKAAEPGVVLLTSPIVGTYYHAPSPGAAPFVEVGDRVNKGQVLCIIEAMKLMNEIESEIDAEVLEILVANGQPVEYGEVLFKLRPLAP